MMRKQLMTKGQAGFSLVELMVVVAIIGVLATIAIPRVNRFIAKSRQSEAQVNLSSLYTFNKNFFVEFQGYTSAFTAMGFRPEGSLRYNAGFTTAAAGPAAYVTLKAPATYDGAVSTLEQCPSKNTVGDQCLTLLGADNVDPVEINEDAVLADDFSGFVASASARLLADAAADEWRINENKQMTNPVDGTMD